MNTMTTGSSPPWLPNARGLVGGPLPPEFSTVSDFVANDVKLMWEDGKFSNYGADMIDREVLVTAIGGVFKVLSYGAEF